MSNYMQALRRLERHPSAPAGVRGEAAKSAERKPASDEAARAPIAARTVRGPAARAPLPCGPEIALLLDRLRTLAAQGEAARVLVFAPVAPGGAARALVDGLAARGRELALPVAVAELTRDGGETVLAGRGAPTHAVGLDGAGLAAAVAGWVDACGPAQLLLIEAPAVTHSADGLLLAAACDGLVLVAETGITARAALREAAARAQAAGCRMLGVVLTKR